jgi:hypothetical protein
MAALVEWWLGFTARTGQRRHGIPSTGSGLGARHRRLVLRWWLAVAEMNSDRSVDGSGRGKDWIVIASLGLLLKLMMMNLVWFWVLRP